MISKWEKKKDTLVAELDATHYLQQGFRVGGNLWKLERMKFLTVVEFELAHKAVVLTLIAH